MSAQERWKVRSHSKPGETILEAMAEWRIDKLHLSRLMDMTTKELEQLISAEIPITEDIAKKLEFSFGIGADFWLAREKKYRHSRISHYKYKTYRQTCSWCLAQLNTEKRKRKYIISSRPELTVDVACSMECAKNLIKDQDNMGNDMWNTKYMPPMNPVSGMRFLKRDKQFDSFEEAAKRADFLSRELQEGTEIFVCDGDIWVEKQTA